MTNLKSNTFITFIFAILYLPVLTLIVLSFNNSSYSTQWHGATFKWYQTLFADPAIWRSSMNSIYLGVISSIVSVFLGLLGAFTLNKKRSPGQRIIRSSIVTMIVIPDIVFASGLLMLFHFSKLKLGFISLLLAHISLSFPFAFTLIGQTLEKLDKNIFEAACDLGASHIRVLCSVIIPLLSPVIFSSFLLCFTLSFDDLIISYFVSGPEFEVLPVHIFSLIKIGVTPEINALSSLVFLLSLTTVFISYNLMKKKNVP